MVGKTFDQAGTFDVFIGRFRPIPAILCFFVEIQKIWDFQYFWANLATFFFQNAILSNLQMSCGSLSIMLSDFRAKRHLIIYPPKRALFGRGLTFF